LDIDDALHQAMHTELETRLKAIEGDIRLAKIGLQVFRWSAGVAIATAIIILVQRLLA